jgi:choline dehydrogenase-like flavoprotein
MTSDRSARLPSPSDPVDLLIVGSGIMGAGVARLVRERLPLARIVMVDGGPVIGARPGEHLHDTTDPDLWNHYNQRTSSGIQSLYLGAEVTGELVDDIRLAAPGMLGLGVLGEDEDGMPSAALAWNTGGMGVHWTAATPSPWGDEVFDGGDVEGWASDLEQAGRLLGVRDSPLGPTNVGSLVLDALGETFGAAAAPGRAPRAMPMAITPAPDGWLRRTGPAAIFPPIGGAADDAFRLLPDTLAMAIEHDGARVSGVRVRDVRTGEERAIHAHEVVVAADTMRTPQLLFASGIRPPALGRRLNEHAFLTGRVLLDLERFGLQPSDLPRRRPGEWSTDSLWLPHSGADQPFHGQIMSTTYVDDEGAPLAHSVGLSWYVPVESRDENRLEFSETDLDAAGLPRISVRFGYSERDLAMIELARASQRRAAEALGAFDAEVESALLPPGSSLHFTGTVRMGPVDDGTSVCGPDARVWGFDNLALAGNGVIPTAVVCNTTLTGAVTAVRAARGVVSRLAATVPVA